MRLYYMTRLSIFEDFIMPQQEIRISTFDKVNDPFELLGSIRGGKNTRHDFAWLKQHWTETNGFISFSDNWRSPLMWAHYANNHAGVCLGIEVPDGVALKIKYQPDRTAMQVDFKKLEHALDEELFREIATTKFQQWEYENEWRILRKLIFDPKESRPEYFYEPFTPDFELREVILGAKSEKSRKEIQKQIFGTTSSITIKSARAAFSTFDMVEQKLQPRLSVSPYTDFTNAERNAASAKRFVEAREAERARKKLAKISRRP